MFCNKCGAECPEGTTYCPRCGNSLQAPPAGGSGVAELTTSGKAIASMVLGILSICCLGNFILGIPALILGILAIKQINRAPQKWAGSGMAIAGIVLGSIGTLLGLVLLVQLGSMFLLARGSFREAGIRSKVSRVKADMRSMATGIEAYFVDNNTYPRWSEEPGVSVRQSGPGEPLVPSFRVAGSQAGSLTTPVAYVMSYFPDPFSADGKQTFAYYATDNGWILFSPGPDRKFDLDWKLYNPAVPQPSPELVPFEYDPTNGTVSSGDIFRVKQ